jgi:carbon monoxide dehydrogenase subunit G
VSRADAGAGAGGYTLAGAVTIRAPAAEILRWLTEAERLEQWMLGVDAAVELEDDATQLRVITSSGVYAGWTFLGTTVVESPQRVVRTYALEDLRTGGVSRAADPSAYLRVVAYGLEATPDGGTRLSCSVKTTIPGLAAAGARAGAKTEQKTLDRSLERLEALVAGRGRGLLGVLRGSRLPPAAF